LRQNEQMKDNPIIILSGLDQKISENSQDFLADAYLLKGGNLSEELINKLSELFDKYSRS
jgi:CheY-like chemotaxis protein